MRFRHIHSRGSSVPTVRKLLQLSALGLLLLLHGLSCAGERRQSVAVDLWPILQWGGFVPVTDLIDLHKQMAEMRDRELRHRLRLLKITLIFTVLVALLSLGYKWLSRLWS